MQSETEGTFSQKWMMDEGLWWWATPGIYTQTWHRHDTEHGAPNNYQIMSRVEKPTQLRDNTRILNHSFKSYNKTDTSILWTLSRIFNLWQTKDQRMSWWLTVNSLFYSIQSKKFTDWLLKMTALYVDSITRISCSVYISHILIYSCPELIFQQKGTPRAF